MDEDEFPIDSPEEWPWEEIDVLHISRDEGGWDVSAELEDGSLIDIVDGMDDEDAQSFIWEYLYYLADYYGVEIDKEIDYTGD